MKVMADTNIIISTLLFPESLPAKILLHIASSHHLVLCDHIVTEIRDVVSRKRPDVSAKPANKERAMLFTKRRGKATLASTFSAATPAKRKRTKYGKCSRPSND